MRQRDMSQEHVGFKADGWFWDEIYCRGAKGEDVLVERTPLEHNQQVNSSITLIAGLLLNDLGFTGGIVQHAQGSGNPSWDPGVGPTPALTDVQLVAEQGRRVPDTIIYVSVTSGVSPGGAPTLPPAASATLLVAFDGGSPQTVTFAGSETTPALVAAAITGQVTGGKGVVNGSNIDITSNTIGPLSQTIVSGGSALPAIGQTAGTYTGSVTPLSPGTRSNTIQVRTTYDYTDLVGVTIREQGLFGGNATSTPNSGYMWNAIRQVARFKSGAVKLVRSVIISLSM